MYYKNHIKGNVKSKVKFNNTGILCGREFLLAWVVVFTPLFAL